MAKSSKLIIGLDFGTTYTGVAYCDEAGVKEGTSGIQLFTQWPGVTGNATNEKVPSRISYGPGEDVKYGNQIKYNTKAEVHSCMKLKLDQTTSGLGSEMERLMIGGPGSSSRDVLTLCSDYLSKVAITVENSLQKQYGPELLKTLNRELVVTVPAVWSERAKDLTLKAVEKAGVPAARVSLVTEPEAAAIYTLKQALEGPGRDQYNVGDLFIVCDAGGGTVDLISYKITQVTPRLRVEEAAIGTGDKCGATFVDQEFLSWLEKWIGSTKFKKIPPHKIRPGSQLLESFDKAKQIFDASEDEWPVTLPSECGIEEDESLQIEERILSLTSHQMKTIFNPVIGRIIKLIRGQISAIEKAQGSTPKMVLLVGGFGRNDYLHRQIQAYCQSRNILVRRPQFPWSAVVRGAVCRGLEPREDRVGAISCRLSRKFYGTCVNSQWDALQHSAEDLYTSEYDGKDWAAGQMTWFVDRGERLPACPPKTLELKLITQIRAHERARCYGVLWGYEGEHAPQRKAKGGQALQEICHIEGDLSNVPRNKFKKSLTPGSDEPYWVIHFTLRATFDAGEITWECLHNGEAKGSVKVSYDN